MGEPAVAAEVAAAVAATAMATTRPRPKNDDRTLATTWVAPFDVLQIPGILMHRSELVERKTNM